MVVINPTHALGRRETAGVEIECKIDLIERPARRGSFLLNRKRRGDTRRLSVGERRDDAEQRRNEEAEFDARRLLDKLTPASKKNKSVAILSPRE